MWAKSGLWEDSSSSEDWSVWTYERFVNPLRFGILAGMNFRSNSAPMALMLSTFFLLDQSFDVWHE